MNTIWVLFLFAHAGPLGDGNSNALAVQEFTSKQKCEAAGRAVSKLANSTVKFIEHVCVEK